MRYLLHGWDGHLLHSLYAYTDFRGNGPPAEACLQVLAGRQTDLPENVQLGVPEEAKKARKAIKAVKYNTKRQ